MRVERQLHLQTSGCHCNEREGRRARFGTYSAKWVRGWDYGWGVDNSWGLKVKGKERAPRI